MDDRVIQLEVCLIGLTTSLIARSVAAVPEVGEQLRIGTSKYIVISREWSMNAPYANDVLTTKPAVMYCKLNVEGLS